MIHTIIFDFGNVVGFFDHQRAIDRLKPYTPLSSEDIRRRVYAGNIEDDYESGRMSTADFAEAILKLCEIDRTPEQYIEAFTDIFWENPDVLEVIPKLKSRYRILLASNTNDAHYRKFKVQFADHLDHFHFLGTSFEAGVRKPAAGFYEYIQARAGCQRSQCLFVDDLPANVEAAIRFGWNAVVYGKGTRLSELLAGCGIRLD